MAKQKKPTGPIVDQPARDLTRRPDLDPALLEQGALGNAALQAQMGGNRTSAEVELDVVRAVALPLVDRASMALQVEVLPDGKVSRFVEILERSNLPEERKQILVDHLLTNDAAARSVRDALTMSFGADGPELRGALSEILDGVWSALGSGAGHDEEGTWRAGDAEIALSDAALKGSVNERAAALVGDLAHAQPEAGAVETTGKDFSSSMRSFCLAIFIALTMDEEEEEEWGGFPVEIDG